MRRCAAWLAVLCGCATLVSAQDNSLFGVLRGDLLELEGTPQAGEFSVRTAEHRVERCRFDQSTYVERAQQRIAMDSVVAGEKLEVVTDRNGAQGRCFARAVRTVVDVAAPRRPAVVARMPVRPYRSVLGELFPRGNLTMAGVVVSVGPESLLLRTRTDGQKLLQLRPDTRFLDGGSPVNGASLKVNTRVFVRAGKSLDDELEAFQVVWGEILPGR